MANTQKSITSITGKILLESGKPAGGIAVRCEDKEIRTLFDGTYKLINIQPGVHVITVNLEGYNESKNEIIVEEGQEVTKDVFLMPAKGRGKIRGFIYAEETGEPAINGGSVFMIRFISNKTVSVDPKNGYYEFLELMPGTYTLWSSVLGYEAQKKVVELANNEEREISFLLKREEEREV